MFQLVGLVVLLSVAFVVGLLVGRRNPKIANAVATAANTAKADAAKVVPPKA